MPKSLRQYPGMRHEPALRLLRLALQLAGTRTGMTIDEMAEFLGVSRRTAERLRDSLVELFPALEWWEDDGRIKRWRMPGSALVGLSEPRPETVAAVEVSARDCDSRGELDRAARLRDAAATLRALMRPSALARAEPDIEALMEAEGIAMRPGPRPVISPGVLANIRRAILGMQLIVVRYKANGAEEPATRILCPYGILYGGRGWLVAHVEGLADMRLWRLDRIDSVDLLDRNFDRLEEFSLTKYAAQSFGVFQEEPQEVLLRFAPEAAADAATWTFHPSQSMEYDSDGALLLRFCAGGKQEILSHLLSWNTSVSVISPASLQREISNLASRLNDHHNNS
jgi:predicted DNA-binding transcriptional regulator YafY